MNDVEQDLRELFDRKASSVGGVAPKLPEPVRKRSRRRELGTVIVGGLTIVALVVGSWTALRAVDLGSDRRTVVDDPWSGYEVYERTATIGAFTITSPSDWYLVRPDSDLSVFQLTNFDHGLDGSACGSELPDDGAALYVARRWGPDARVADSVDFPPVFDPAAEETEGPCGPGRYVTFTDVGVGAFIAWAAFGDQTDPDDRELVFDAFADMTFDRRMASRPLLPAAYVLAGGENAAGPWRLELGPSSAEENANVHLQIVASEGSGVDAGSFTVPDVPIEQAGGDPTFGAVTKEASGVELRLEEGTPPIPAQVVPLPPTMPFDFDLFFASNPSDVQAQAMAIGMPELSTASPRPDEDLAELTAVHDHLEAALQRLWTELAYVDELDGEIAAAERDLDALADEIGPGGPTEEQADRMRANQDLIVRFRDSMTEHLTTVASLRVRVESLREARNVLVVGSDPALFPTTVTVTCTGDRDGGTIVSGPAVVAQDDGVHIEVLNAIPNERVFLDLGTRMAPVEVAGGQRMELALDKTVPRTLELVCTYETPPETWRRPTHPLTVIG